MASINPPWRFDPLQMPVNLSWGAPPGGDFVLIQLSASQGAATFTASSPTGSASSFDGTECPLTVAIGSLFPGAAIVYQNVDLVVTPTTTYQVFLPTDATLQITDTLIGPASSPSPQSRADELATLEAGTPLPPSTTIQVGYRSTLTAYNHFVGNPFATKADADAAALSLNAGGIGSVGAAGQYTIPNGSSPPPPGPWDGFQLVILWVPYVVESGTYYSAKLNATYLIQLPFSVESPAPPPEIPAFSINTTGYPWTAEISVFPKEGISVDPTNSDLPLKWTNGSPPLGPDGNPWSPFGTPSTDIADAFLWSISYNEAAGTGSSQEYPFAIVVDDHLTMDPPASPHNPMVRNSILQLYPTFISSFITLPSSWGVDGYADVPYGTSFQVPDTWSDLTTPGPLPLIDADTP